MRRSAARITRSAAPTPEPRPNHAPPPSQPHQSLPRRRNQRRHGAISPSNHPRTTASAPRRRRTARRNRLAPSLHQSIRQSQPKRIETIMRHHRHHHARNNQRQPTPAPHATPAPCLPRPTISNTDHPSDAPNAATSAHATPNGTAPRCSTSSASANPGIARNALAIAAADDRRPAAAAPGTKPVDATGNTAASPGQLRPHARLHRRGAHHQPHHRRPRRQLEPPPPHRPCAAPQAPRPSRPGQPQRHRQHAILSRLALTASHST